MSGNFMRVEMLPALHGDCLVVEYGDEKRTRRLLIDGGPIGAWDALEARIARLPAGNRGIELVVMSHVDTDHVEGLVRLFAEPKWPFVVEEVWFNGWCHLETAHGMLGGRQGEFFSALLAHRLKRGEWNRSFKGGPVLVPDQGPLPVVDLPGEMKLTLLSPTPKRLAALRNDWSKSLKKDGIKPGDLDNAWKVLARQKKYLPGQGLLGSTPELDELLEAQAKPDDAVANGSSIAFLAECPGGSCLLLADAFTDVVTGSLRRLLAERKLDRLAVDAVKVAHHGSARNIDDDLLALVESPRFLISTNGAQFCHPDEEAIQRIIARSVVQPPKLFFNYTSDYNKKWQDADLKRTLNYKAEFRSNDGPPMVVTLGKGKTD